MVPNCVPRLRNFTRNIRPLLHISPNQKESRFHIFLRQGVQQSQRMRFIRPVVVSQRQRSLRRAFSGKRPPIPLPRRCHGLISSENRSHANRAPYGPKHRHVIVNVRQAQASCCVAGGFTFLQLLPSRFRDILPI